MGVGKREIRELGKGGEVREGEKQKERLEGVKRRRREGRDCCSKCGGT